MPIRKTDFAVNEEILNRIENFGAQINKVVEGKKIDYIMPLETKGALLVDFACEESHLSDSLNIIYPRALRYLTPTEIASSRILLVDDIFFSGRHLCRVYNRIQCYGVLPENIQCMALLDFSSGDRDKDYEGEMHDRICEYMTPGSSIKRSETLLFLQSEILEKTMPSVYDHLTVEAEDVGADKYFQMLSIFSDKNRLLHYGRRGAYQTSSILLDDLFDGNWDVPPKARIWYNFERKTLRITPVGFISGKNIDQNLDFSKCMFDIIVKPVAAEQPQEREEAEYEAAVLAGRLQQLILLKKTLFDLQLRFKLDRNHLNRYYPSLNVVEKITQVLKSGKMSELPPRTEINEDQSYNGAIRAIINLNKDSWKNQDVSCRKDRERRGYSASEIFSILKDYSKAALHAAIDYCFDYHYLAVFRKREQDGFLRCYRTTEISGDYLPEEIFGAAVIYSISGPTPDWLLNKVFPILRSVSPGRLNDGPFVITKAYFGDVTCIKQSEESLHTWKDVQSELWDIEEFGGGVRYRKKDDAETQEKIRGVLDDQRLSGFRDTLAALIFLLENLGKKAGVLLDILTPGYGGTDYIVHNIEQMLSNGTKYPSEKALKSIQWHSKGADEKLNIILSLFDDDDNLISKLKRRCTRLQSSYLIQIQAEKAVEKAVPFPSRILYDALVEIKSSLSGAVVATSKNDFHGFQVSLSRIGILSTQRNRNLRNLLSKISQTIYPTLKAISGHIYNSSYYKKYLLQEDENFSFILGYDLTGARREVVPDGEELTRYDDQLHKFIANWIIAFNGKLSTSGMNAGDLRFGFFRTLDEAINAGCWILHHSLQLFHTNYFPIGPEAIGMVVTMGSYKTDAMGNSSGATLDTSGHWLKGKIKGRDRIDHTSGIVGRAKSKFNESQLWIIEDEKFEVDRTHRPQVGNKQKLSYKNKYIHLSPVDVDAFIEAKRFPWLMHNSR